MKCPTGKNQSLDKIVNYSSLAATIVVTYAAVFYLGREMDKIKGDLVLQRRRERWAFLLFVKQNIRISTDVINYVRQSKLSTGDLSYDDGSRAELGRLMDTGSEYERPALGGQYTPVNLGAPSYPSSSYAPNNDTLTPYGGGYSNSGRQYKPPSGPPPSSQYAPEPSDRQNYNNYSRESFDMQEMPPRTVQSSIP